MELEASNKTSSTTQANIPLTAPPFDIAAVTAPGANGPMAKRITREQASNLRTTWPTPATWPRPSPRSRAVERYLHRARDYWHTSPRRYRSRSDATHELGNIRCVTSIELIFGRLGDAMTPEEKARQEIDRQLCLCGWIVQDRWDMNISAGLGIVIREFPLPVSEADYLLCVLALIF